MKPKFEAGKEYKTRDGRRAKVYEVYDSYIHGAILLDNEHWCNVHWLADGRIVRSREYGPDIILPKRKPREWTLGRFLLPDGKIVIRDTKHCPAVYDDCEIIKVREVLEDD